MDDVERMREQESRCCSLRGSGGSASEVDPFLWSRGRSSLRDCQDLEISVPSKQERSRRLSWLDIPGFCYFKLLPEPYIVMDLRLFVWGKSMLKVVVGAQEQFLH